MINPGTYGVTGAITMQTLDANNAAVDTGTFTLPPGYFTHGNITSFTVTPQNSGVGTYPAAYTFNVIPNGEIPRYGYLWIDLPPDVEIINERDFEDSCGTGLFAFTNT